MALEEQLLEDNIPPLRPFLLPPPELVERWQDRLVLRTFGWSLKCFKDLPELLSTLLCALRGM